MNDYTLEILTEEPSMELFLRGFFLVFYRKIMFWIKIALSEHMRVKAI